MNAALRAITRRAIKTATLTAITIDTIAITTNHNQLINNIITAIALTTGYTLIHIALTPDTPHDQQ